MEDIAICRLTGADVVRHVLVQRIIAAYEKYDEKKHAVGAKAESAPKTGSAPARGIPYKGGKGKR